MNADSHSGVVAILFTDVESSTRLWEQDGERMSRALAGHDALARTVVESHHGTIVKMTGDGMHAAFADPLDALNATLRMQTALADPTATNGVALRVRCGLHAGMVERRDGDLFGTPVNRAARIMGVAHGGQVLLSQAVVELIRERLPAGVTLCDLGSVRLRDLASPEHIHQLMHAHLRHDFPALRSLDATPNNLPQQVTSFIGREGEFAEVKKLLGKTRLLTLLGVGGIGKTRLSLQVAADIMDDYPDGVWLVELAPLTDARLVPQAVASVLGVKEEVGHPVVEVLVKFVKDRQMLLILDNCEHLVQACAELAKQLLQFGPPLKVLVSSREPLHVAGETSYQVPALAVPDPQEKVAVAALTQYEAVRLFVDRALAVHSSFEVTDRNATVVSNICGRLDGIPLALELAAARVRALPVEKIDEHLADRFRLLTGGDRTALPRHQTLRALIDWSYDLLSEAERIVLRRLAVFAGGWTLEAAEAVAAGGAIDRSDLLDILSHLVEKSLVSLDHQGERYALLETIKHYAQERLTESGEEDEVRTRHLHCYLTLAEEEKGAEDANWFTRLDLELENLLSAHAWCDRTPRGAALGLRLVPHLRSYWIHRGLMGVGHQVMADALARPGTQERNLARSQALAGAGALSYFMGRYAEAQAYLEESVAIAREAGDKYQAAESLSQMGRLFMSRGDLVTARVRAEEGLVLARELGDPPILVRSLNRLGELCRAEGNPSGAELFYEEALAVNRQLGGKGLSAGLLCNLAITAIERSDDDRARMLLLEGIANAEEIGSKWRACGILDVCSGLAVHLQEFEHAARLYGSTEAQHKQIGSPREAVDDAFIAPLIARTRETLGAAAFATAEAAGRALSYEDAMAEARAWLEKPA